MITCENCGTAIDIEKNKRCPNCGASYARNKDYNELKNINKKDKEYDFREREADIKAKELANKILEKQTDMVETQKKTTSVTSIVAIIIIIIILIIMGFMLRRFFNFF